MKDSIIVKIGIENEESILITEEVIITRDEFCESVDRLESKGYGLMIWKWMVILCDGKIINNNLDKRDIIPCLFFWMHGYFNGCVDKKKKENDG